MNANIPNKYITFKLYYIMATVIFRFADSVIFFLSIYMDNMVSKYYQSTFNFEYIWDFILNFAQNEKCLLWTLHSIL